MNPNHHRHGKPLHSQLSILHSRFSAGLTLIEVLAALTILGTTITSMLVAYGQAAHQMHDARLRREAHERAAELLVRWELDAEPLDTNAQGILPRTENFLSASPRTEIDAQDQWHWTRTVRRVRPTPQVEMNEITLTVERQYETGRRENLATVVWLAPVAQRQEPTS